MTEHKSNLDKLCNCENIGKEPYYSHELAKTFFNNYISKVTNLPAIVEEDVVSNLLMGNSNIKAEYMVKGKNFSLPGLS
jgi:hypothetical protein